MASNDISKTVFSGTYSNVPVYELRLGPHLVMRRRSDNYVNATHILKVAELDKPARTRVLEKEVQLGVHEKVQGGYGKYQGTWIPLESGRELAKKYHVLPILLPLFDFVPGEQSPPPAPRHSTASAPRAKTAKALAKQASQQPAVAVAAPPPRLPKSRNSQLSLATEVSYEPSYDETIEQVHEDDAFETSTVASQSMIDDDDYSTVAGSRKRRRKNEQPSAHRAWADDLLDYFVVAGSDPSHTESFAPPPPPVGVDVNIPVDDQNHTALHWAAAMGDTEYVKDLLKAGADLFSGNIRGETPIIKCSIFANSYERNSYRKMVEILSASITTTDRFGATVLHHVGKSSVAGLHTGRACFYVDVLLDQLTHQLDNPSFLEFVNRRDQYGETAFHIFSRVSSRATRLFQGRGIPSDIANAAGETVDNILCDRRAKRALRQAQLGRKSGGVNVIPSSSPVAPSSPIGWEADNGLGSRVDDYVFKHPATTKSGQSFSKSMTNFHSTAVKSFMQAGDDELAAKDALLADLRAAISRTNAKTIQLQQENEQLGAEPVNDISALSEERAQLAKEAEAYSEQMQHRFLHQSIRENEQKARAKWAHKRTDLTDEEELQERIWCAQELHAEQEKRKALTAKLVEAQANAGMDEMGEMGLRVLEKTLGCPRDRLLAMIPDLIDEMALENKNPALLVSAE